MPHLMLRKDDPWPDALEEPDIRDWKVRDATGQVLGHISSVIVEPEEGVLKAILLGPNERYEADDLHVGDEVVQVDVENAAEREPPEPPSGASARSFDEAFRAHYAETYGETDQSYAAYEPAYQFGRELAQDADFVRRPYEDVEEDLRSLYSRRFEEPSYDEVAAAIRFGLERGRTLKSYNVEGFDREQKQHVGGSKLDKSATAETGASLAQAPPEGDVDA